MGNEDDSPIRFESGITVQTEEGDGPNEDQLPVKIESEITLEKDSQEYEDISHRVRRSGRCRQREKKRQQAREEQALKEPTYLQSKDEGESRPGDFGNSFAKIPLADSMILQ